MIPTNMLFCLFPQNLILSIETLLKVTMSVLSPLEFALAYDGLVLCAKGHGS